MTHSLPGWLPIGNRIVKGLNSVGLRLGTINLLTVPGRKTGEPRTTPVSPLTVQERTYIIAGLHDAAWAKNVRAAGRGKLGQGRSSQKVSLTEVDDLPTKRLVMKSFPLEVPRGVFFFQTLGLVTSADPVEFENAADKVAVFEVIPASA